MKPGDLVKLKDWEPEQKQWLGNEARYLEFRLDPLAGEIRFDKSGLGINDVAVVINDGHVDHYVGKPMTEHGVKHWLERYIQVLTSRGLIGWLNEYDLEVI